DGHGSAYVPRRRRDRGGRQHDAQRRRARAPDGQVRARGVRLRSRPEGPRRDVGGGVRPRRAGQGSARRRGSGAPGRLQLRHVRPHRRPHERRSAHAARPRRDGRVRRPGRHGAADPQSRGPQPAGRGQPARAVPAQVRPAGGRRHDDARLQPAHPPAGAQLRESGRLGRQLRRRHRVRSSRLDHLRGDGRRAEPHEGGSAVPAPSRLLLLRAGRPRAGRSAADGAAPRDGAVRTRGRRRRPANRHRLPDRGPRVGPGCRVLPVPPQEPGEARGRWSAADPRRPRRPATGHAQRSDAGRRARRGVVRHRRAGPRVHRRQRPARCLQPGARQGRGAVQPARGLLVRRGLDLLRLHERRRRRERRRQLGRLPRGVRAGLGVPPAPAARRPAHPLVRVPGRRRARLPGQPDGDAARRPAALRGRRQHPLRRHASAAARPGSCQPAHRPVRGRRPVRVRRQHLQRVGARGRLLQPERPVALLQRLRGVRGDALGEPRRRHDVRRHGSLGAGTAL
ncbi:MAG: hypothetical protein AVDCRST_MAG79-1215, partial [uncultured Thermoleophilia bacterium]